MARLDTKGELVTTCKHLIDTPTCTICTHGKSYDPWRLYPPVDYVAHNLDLTPPRPVYPSDQGCPSQADWDAVEQRRKEANADCELCGLLDEMSTTGIDVLTGFEIHTCFDGWQEFVVRPLATQYPEPRVVGRPAWAKQHDFDGGTFLGFYRNELTSLAGFGYDPEFASIH